MPTYIKPNGKEIEINDSSVPYALSIGWKPKGAEIVQPVVDAESDIEFLRRKYEQVTGKKPHHKMKEAALLKAIEHGDSGTGS